MLETIEKMDEQSNGLESMMNLLETRLMDKIKDLESELHIYKTAVKNGVQASTESGPVEPRIDVPKLDKGMGITSDAKKVITACNYLTDGVLMWWRHRCSEAKGRDLPMDTWAKFQAKLKERFYPKDALREACTKLRQLRHDKTIPEYVKKFTEIKFQIPNLGED
ncbi:hypothetical protein V6N13_043957 [Hibiscus sabdariffa]